MSGFAARLRNWFQRPKKPQPAPGPEPESEPESGLEPESELELGPEPAPVPEKIGQRIHRVAESILENERLTADLDDPAAQALLNWGLSVGERIVQGTADVDDDEEAEQAMYPRLRATRSLMRAVNRWIASQREGNAEGRDKALDSILEQASILYGRPIEALNAQQRDALIRAQAQYAGDPPQLIARLRELFEHPDDRPNDEQGGE